MKKILIAIILSLSFAAVFSHSTQKVNAEEYASIIESIDIYGPNSYSYVVEVPNNNIIDFDKVMNAVFSSGGNASWQYTIEIVFHNYFVTSFSMLLTGLWTWDGNYDNLTIESDNETLSYETYSPPNIITFSNFTNKNGYVLSAYLTAFGYDLTNFSISFQNNGYTQGYNQGYNDGLLQGNNQGYNQGYIQGETSGFNSGYEKGFREGSESEHDLYSMILAVLDTPFTVFDYIFDFNVLGINIKNIILSFATIAIAVFVIKKFI